MHTLHEMSLLLFNWDVTLFIVYTYKKLDFILYDHTIHP